MKKIIITNLVLLIIILLSNWFFIETIPTHVNGVVKNNILLITFQQSIDLFYGIINFPVIFTLMAIGINIYLYFNCCKENK